MFKKSLCPAYGKVCGACNGENHFPSSPKCPKKKVHAVRSTEGTAESYDDYWIGTLESNGQRMFASMEVNSKAVTFQLDSGAETNIITEDLVPSENIKPTRRCITSWGGENCTPIGETEVTLVNPVNDSAYNVNFTVMPRGYICLLGLGSLMDMGLISVNTDTFNVASLTVTDITQKYPSVFDDGLGKLSGKVKLHLQADCQPKVLPARRIPFAIQKEVQEELQ